MDNLLGYDNKFFDALGKITDIVILNFLCILFSIPLITIGTSITSTYYVAMKIMKGEEPYILKSFMKSFKENLKPGIIIWSIFIVLAGILILDFNISNQISNKTFSIILKFVCSIVGIVYIFAFTYVFPILAKFENSIKNTIINSILISIQNLPYTIIMVIVNLIPIIFTMVFPSSWGYILFFFVVIGIGIITIINSILLNKILDKYIS